MVLFRLFVNGYMIDILLPFAMYLVLGVAKQTILRSGIARGVFVFAIGAVTETLQYFGVPIFGRTFDLLDYLMFGVGMGLRRSSRGLCCLGSQQGYPLGRVIASDRRELISRPTPAAPDPRLRRSVVSRLFLLGAIV